MKIFNSPDIRLVVIIGNLPPELAYLRSENEVNLAESIETGRHPYEQVKKLEVLVAQAEHYQVETVITTYSPYVMAHLNNLLQGSSDPAIREKQGKHLFNEGASYFISHEKVEVYESKRNIAGAFSLEAIPYDEEDKAFHWDTLSEPSVDIQQIFFKIYQPKTN